MVLAEGKMVIEELGGGVEEGKGAGSERGVSKSKKIGEALKKELKRQES